MITLKVEKYCENCKKIKPIVAQMTDFNTDFDLYFRDTIIECEHREQCAAMCQDLKERMIWQKH